MRKILFLFGWTWATGISLVISLILLNSYVSNQEGPALLAVQAREMLPKSTDQMYAALPQVLGSFTAEVNKVDARPDILLLFL